MTHQRVEQIISTKVLCKQPGRYIGWPSVARAAGGDLLAVFSGDRDAHVCLAGKTQLVRSTDGGETWGAPVTINNSPLDDRDAGIVTLPDGTLLVSWFISFHHPDAHPARDTASWRPYLKRISAAEKEQWLGKKTSDNPETWLSGYWVRRSIDHGHTWEAPVRVATSAPHGPVVLSDGSLLYLGAPQHYNPEKRIVAQKSFDGGRTWETVADWSAVTPDGACRLVEPHAVEAAPGRVVGLFRCESMGGKVPSEKRDYAVLWQAESADGGRTWNSPRPTGIWGKPPHLLRLRDGRLLVTYGHRREPYGERACLSADGGRTWDTGNEIILTAAPGGDLGYPASLELDDGRIITVYYEKDRPGEKPCLKATTWQPGT